MNDDLKFRIKKALRTVAKQKTVISYRMLAIEAEIPGPQAIHKLTLCLEEIFQDDHLKGDISLAPLAVSRGEPVIPRPGFFILLQKLDLYHGAEQGPEAIAKHHSLLQEIYNTISEK
ncbi:hypothetical protein [Kiloniella antarctica]|uniref:Uncharacterized protein n=1 Tax=Kiloniella antarctica TaxID=1550907 RepID=A0ABW5BMG0_9PROT